MRELGRVYNWLIREGSLMGDIWAELFDTKGNILGKTSWAKARNWFIQGICTKRLTCMMVNQREWLQMRLDR